MKIGKLLFAGLLTVAFALPSAAQDKQYDVKLHVYSQEEQKAEAANRQKKENRPETVKKTGQSKEAAEAQGKMQHGKPAGKMQDCDQCDKMDGGKCEMGEGQCGMMGGGKCEMMAEGQCDKMQGRPMMGQGRQGMGPMQQGGGMQFGNSVQYREFRRRQLADFEGKRFYLGTNALALVVGMPNINAEWRRDERMGVRLSVGGSFWSWSGEDMSVGGLWFNPEVRWYLGETKGWYAGPMAKVGYFGAYGEHRTSIAVGATLGYMQRVSRKFAVDYNVGVGFSAVGHDRSDEYYLNGVYYPDGGTEWTTRFAPLKIGISLVWQTCSKSY